MNSPISNGARSQPLGATVLQGATADDFTISPMMRHMAVVFGHAAFKVALEQVVRGGLNSLFRTTVGRI